MSFSALAVVHSREFPPVKIQYARLAAEIYNIRRDIKAKLPRFVDTSFVYYTKKFCSFLFSLR